VSEGVEGRFSWGWGTDHVDDVVCQLAGVVRGQVVTAGLDQKQLSIELPVEIFQGVQVLGDVLTDLQRSGPLEKI
jgi:hypothetical protein